MCSECPYSGEKLMTALDHMKKKHQFKGTLEDILDKETYNQCGQTSLRVAQGKFYESFHEKTRLISIVLYQMFCPTIHNL